jgi:RNA recognition motif-containing protein
VNFKTKEAVDEACANVNGSFWHGRRVTCIPRQPKVEKEPRRESFRHRNSPDTPTPQLYIGNIPYETTDAELNRLFRSIENITDVRVAVDRGTGWPRGFAHVDFKSVEACIEGKKRLEGAMLGGRHLKFDYAHGYRRGEDKDKNSRSIYNTESEHTESEYTESK